jgi:sigma-B regulation protein RsbU (phosphoserine phosphatase)
VSRDGLPPAENAHPLPDGEALYEEAPCGLMLTDTDGTIRRVNATFCRWIGAEAAELVGRTRVQQLLTMGGRIFHQTHWAPLLQIQGSVAEVKLDVLHRDGRRLPMLMNAIRRAHGGQLFDELSMVIAEDRHAYERELLQARRRAEQLLQQERQMQQALAQAEDRLKLALEAAEDRALFAEQLIGIVSHDLRTPLQAIRLGTQLLARTALDEAQLKTVANVLRSSRRAQRLVADLLDFTVARVGRGISVAPQPIDLQHVVADSVDELRAAYPQQPFALRHHGGTAATADASRIAQLIGNLVANAATYGAPGRPITITSHGSDAGGLAIQVHNEGPPIDAALLPRLFEPMVRGDTQAADRSVGLGLFIVREIARAHGGSVSVASAEETGTTFTFQAPAAKAAA